MAVDMSPNICGSGLKQFLRLVPEEHPLLEPSEPRRDHLTDIRFIVIYLANHVFMQQSSPAFHYSLIFIAMASPLLLPAPVAAGTIRIGQIFTDPLNPHSDSLFNELDSLPFKTPRVNYDYKETISCDDGGRFIQRQSDTSNESSILVQADSTTYTTLRDPLSAFRYISRRASSQSYLHKAALRYQQLYFVTAIQELSNPRFMGGISSTFNIENLHLHRRDSGAYLDDHDGHIIYAVELRKVFCRIGSPEDPQRPSDVSYAFKHYKLQGEEKLQLAVGLGQSVTAAEFRALVAISSDSDYTDESAGSSDMEDDEDEGCMCCASSISNASYRRY